MILSRLIPQNHLNVCRAKSLSYWLTQKSDFPLVFHRSSSLDKLVHCSQQRLSFTTSLHNQLRKSITVSRHTTNQSAAVNKTANQNDCLNKAANKSSDISQRSSDVGRGKTELKENIYTIPNCLTLGRFLIAPYLGYMVIQEQFNIACGLFLLTSLTDVLDGYIARNWKGQSSVLGSVIDPFADKFLVTILAVTLTAVHLIPVWLTALVLSRDLYLVLNGFRVRYVTLPPPKTFKRYFDFSHPTASVQPSLISKVNTGVQLLLLTSTCAAPVFNYVDHIGLQFLWGVTAFTTSWSFLDYLTTAPYTPLNKQ